MIRRFLAAVVVAMWLGTAASAQLRDAVLNGDVQRVKEMLESGADANESYENGMTSIYFAEKPEIVDLLLKHGAKLEIRDRARIQTPIESIAEQYFNDEDHHEIWKIMVGKLRDGGAKYTIDAAIYMNDVNFVKELLDQNDSWVNKRRQSQSVPLEVAARTGRTEICKLLLEHGADPDNFEQGNGWPIIMHAAGHPDIVKLLIDHGANLKRRISCHGGMTGISIVEQEATALHYAAMSGNVESVKLLLAAGLDPSAADSEGNTPLHIALRTERLYSQNKKAHSSYVDVIKLLLENDASLKLKDHQDRTPAELAKEIKTPRIIRRLIQKKQRELDEQRSKAFYPKDEE